MLLSIYVFFRPGFFEIKLFCQHVRNDRDQGGGRRLSVTRGDPKNQAETL